MDYLREITKIYGRQDEFLHRSLHGGKISVLSLDTICDDKKVCNYVLQPLAQVTENCTSQDIFQKILLGANVKKEPNVQAAVADIANGYALVLVEEVCFAVDARLAVGRAVIEPPTSMVMRGPREGFTEDVKTNLALLRKRLKTQNFKTENFSVGKYTNTTVAVCYLQGVAKKQLVDNVVQKLQRVDVDGVLDSSYLARYLDGNKTFLFRRVGTAEKPDIVAGKLLEGRIAIVVDGSPMVLTVPYLYVEDLQSPSDYYENSLMTSINRILRLVSVLASVLLPSLYVCLQMYNYQIIPLKFLITILNATQSIPFSPLSEMLMIIVIFDILREANLRMPSAVGITLSLVGAIVLGDAAVKAGLIGAPAVMIGALSGIGLFTTPDNTLIFSLLRFAITFVGGIMGIMGVLLSALLILLYLASLEEYQTPLLAPFAPDLPQDRQDAVLQSPLPSQKKRPSSFPNQNRTRRG